MNMSKWCFSVVVAVCSLSSLYAGADNPRSSKKHYLDSKAISVTKDGIIIETGKGPICVKKLRADTKGLFILKKDCVAQVQEKSIYKCQMCPRTFTSRDALYDHIWKVHGHMSG